MVSLRLVVLSRSDRGVRSEVSEGVVPLIFTKYDWKKAWKILAHCSRVFTI